jgi:hypothetical protein
MGVEFVTSEPTALKKWLKVSDCGPIALNSFVVNDLRSFKQPMAIVQAAPTLESLNREGRLMLFNETKEVVKTAPKIFSE